MKKGLSVHSGSIVVALLSIVLLANAVCIDIDIKPGSCPNAINPNSNGVVPVAILTTDSFDASTVDAPTVHFRAPYQSQYMAFDTDGIGRMEDADGDGDLDMVLHFKVKDTGIQHGDERQMLII